MLESSEKQAYLEKRPGFSGRTNGSFSKDGRKNIGKLIMDGVTFRDACRAEAPKCLELLKLARDNEDVPFPTRVAAAIHLLDRGYGKPKESLEVTQGRPLASLDVEAIRAEIEALRAGESAERVIECTDAVIVPGSAVALFAPDYPVEQPTDE